MCGRRGSGRSPWAGSCDEAIQSQGKPSCPDLMRASIAGKRFAKGMDERVKPAYDDHGSRTHANTFPRRLCARVVREIFASSKEEGAGNAGCVDCTRGLACERKKHTSVITTGTPDRPGIPCASGFNGFLRALPGDRAFLPPSLTDHHPISLISASGYQDHTTSPSATGRLRLVRRPRPSHPAPNVRDDRETPLFIGYGITPLYCCFYLFEKRNIFCRRTGQPKSR
jgi:hypothetical protein